MDAVRIQAGATEQILATILDGSGAAITGLSDVKIEIRRKSDGKYLDFTDNTFKSSGWTTRQTPMTEVSATNSAGMYLYNFNTNGLSNRYTEEDFAIRVTCASAGANLPQEGELKVGGYVDQIGVFEGGARGGYAGMDPEQMLRFAKSVWEVVLRNKETAADVLLSKSEFDATKDKVLLAEPIEMPDLTPLQKAIDRVDSSLTKGIDGLRTLMAGSAKLIAEEMAKNHDALIAICQQSCDMMTKMMNEPEKDYTEEFTKLENMIMAIDVNVLNPVLDEIRIGVQNVLSFEGDHRKQAAAAAEATQKMTEMMDKITEVQAAINAPEKPVEEPPATPLPSHMTDVAAEELKQ